VVYLNILDGALLSWLIRRGNGPGPFFHYASVSPLSSSLGNSSRPYLSQEFYLQASQASFRSGAADTAAQRGISDT